MYITGRWFRGITPRSQRGCRGFKSPPVHYQVSSAALMCGANEPRSRYPRVPAPNFAAQLPILAAWSCYKPAQGSGLAPRSESLHGTWAATDQSPTRAASGCHTVRSPVFCPLQLRQCRFGHCRVLYQRGHPVGVGYKHPHLLGLRDLA